MTLLEQKSLNRIRNEIMRELQLYSFPEGSGTTTVVHVKDVKKCIDSILFKKESESENGTK